MSLSRRPFLLASDAASVLPILQQLKTVLGELMTAQLLPSGHSQLKALQLMPPLRCCLSCFLPAAEDAARAAAYSAAAAAARPAGV
jgi:hypothetical protein